MPSVSEKQHHFMQAVAHSKEFAKKVDVPQSVGKDFVKADKALGNNFSKEEMVSAIKPVATNTTTPGKFLGIF